MTTAKRPRNILFLWTDEQRPDTIGAYHHDRAPLRGLTPNVDRLAAGGAIFDQAYCTEPICTPSRGSVITGVYPHAHGATTNNLILSTDVPTIAELLKPHGYVCGYAGKWHLGHELTPQRGFEDFWSSIEDEYTHGHGLGRGEQAFSDYHHWLVSQGYTPPDTAEDGTRVFSRNTAARLPEEVGKPAFLAREACRFLEERVAAGNGPDGTQPPFALYVNFLEPHFPFFGPWDDLFSADDVRLPETWHGPVDEGMPLRYRLRREGFATRNPHVRSQDEQAWKEAAARYWGLASLVDKYVGVILDRLESLGLAEDTIVVYSSDHGEMIGEHRMMAKAMPYEGASRVPLILRAPGHIPTQRFTIPVSQIDLVPTLLDLLGHEAPHHVHGSSLLPHLTSSATGAPSTTGTNATRTNGSSADLDDTNPVVIEWHGVPRGGAVSGYRPPENNGSPESEHILRIMAAQTRTIRSGPWKLTVDQAGEHELYNLDSDPLETHNLLFNSRLTDEAKLAAQDLWHQLRAWQQQTGDTAELPPHPLP